MNKEQSANRPKERPSREAIRGLDESFVLAPYEAVALASQKTPHESHALPVVVIPGIPIPSVEPRYPNFVRSRKVPNSSSLGLIYIFVAPILIDCRRRVVALQLKES